MVDDGYFDVVDKKAVFIGCSTTNQDIVSKAGCASHPRQGLNHPRDVSISSRVALNLVGGELSHGKGRFFRAGKFTAYHYFSEFGGLLSQAEVQLKRASQSHLNVICGERFVAHIAGPNVIKSWGHIANFIVALFVRDGAKFGVD